MINSDIIWCIGPPKTATTWLWDNMKSDTRFTTYNNLKEPALLQEYDITPRGQQHHVWTSKFPGSYEEKFISMREDMLDTIRYSKTPVLDFSNCYNEATMFPENVKTIAKEFNLSVICILRDPIDILISILNFMNISSMIIKKNSTVGELENRLTDPKLDGIVGPPKYSKWLPKWLEIPDIDITLLDYDRLGDIKYVSDTLGFEFQQTVETSNVTKTRSLRRDKLDIDLLNTLNKFYAEDKKYIQRLKDKY